MTTLTAPVATWSAREIAAALGAPPPTDEQQAVIEGPLVSTLVVAGAGSGKTETMASRVLWLVANGRVRPEEVIGLTFTRKASLELAARLGDRLRLLRAKGVWRPQSQEPGALIPPTVSTYHAYAGRLVSEHGLRVGVEPDARLLSEAAAWQVAHEVVHAHTGEMPGLDYASSTVVQAVVHLSGELAEHLVDPAQVHEWLLDRAASLEALPGRDGKKATAVGSQTAQALRRQALVLPLVQAYQEAKQGRSALDFADQMALAARLARDLDSVRAAERARYRVVLLDEFQDTSEAQMVLLSSLYAGSTVPVTAVGDPHQSIYGWRGASATTLSRFPRDFAGPAGPAPVLPLSTSWRNGHAVLATANTAAAPLRERSRIQVPRLRPAPSADRGRVVAARLGTHVEEAGYVADWVAARFLDPTGSPTGHSAAVLCRKRSQFDPVVAALRERGLPVEVVGLGGLLNAPELVDLVGLLWAVQDPGQGAQIMRLLTGPVCRLGAADIDVLWTWARHLVEDHQEEEATLGEALDTPPPPRWTTSRGTALSAAARARVQTMGAAIRRVRDAVGAPLPDLLLEAERALGLDIEVAADPHRTTADGQSWARAHLDALVDVSAAFAASADRPTLGGFLDWLDAARVHERGLDDVDVPEIAEVSVHRGAVQVLTVHAAKGLEWDLVAVPGMAEGVFPALSGRAGHGPQGWRHQPFGVKGWLSGLGHLPYPLRGDSEGLPSLPWWSLTSTHHLDETLQDTAAAGLAHQVEEERRLAYVAFTRARDQLLLTAPVWSTGKTPRQTSRFLDEVLEQVQVDRWAELPEGADAVNPLLAEESTAPWPVTPGPRRRAVAEAVQTVLEGRVRTATPDLDPADPQVQQTALLLAERARHRGEPGADLTAQLPLHVSTSAVLDLMADPDRFARRLRRPLPAAPAPQARLGTEFHAWVEAHFAQATLVDVDDLPGSSDAATGPDGPRSMGDLRRSFLASEWAHQVPAEVEVAVETTVGGRVVRGRIDAVFPRTGGGVTVVDWKTGAPGSAAEQERRSFQLAMYRLGYARLTGLPLEVVEGAFFYASTGETVRPVLADEATLERLVSDLVT